MDNTKIKILLVDDEVDVLEVLTYNLLNQGYQILTANDGSEAVDMAIKYKPRLIIMDVMMPNMDGIEACEIIRKNNELNNTIIMFLTARGEDYSHIAAFDAGADDYVTKPIKPKILMSKVKSLLRRLENVDSINETILAGDIIINRESYNVNHNGKILFLPRKEFELLSALALKSDRVISREQIMEKVWGLDVVVGDRTIDVHILKLRKKFGDEYFQTIKGVGYKFVAKQLSN
jgi:two-component system alkaline phosphatase synthesis response regulator PhoP